MTIKITNRSRKFLWLLISGLVTFLLIVVICVAFYKSHYRTLKASNRNYKLVVAKSEAALEKGLGGRASLPVSEGMLFEFQGSAVRCFWMKGMNFPLDIIWLSSNKRVEYVQSNVSPKTYPESFCPNQTAQYVIELNAGQAHYSDINIGQTLVF